jgi:AcrR family transcriptional regulator
LSSTKSSIGPRDAGKGGRQRRPSRAERGQQIRESLFEAATKVVGQQGYANAMVSTIASTADVAQGTFYNYFESRQDLFDNLLPRLGQEMLQFIREEASDSSNGREREERSFRAFFTFLKIRPEFYRILYEAELFAPAAFKRHTETIAAGYVRTLDRELKCGELKTRDPRDLEAIAFMLMGARHYLCMRFARRDGETVSLPEWVVRAYMNLVVTGLYTS